MQRETKFWCQMQCETKASGKALWTWQASSTRQIHDLLRSAATFKQKQGSKKNNSHTKATVGKATVGKSNGQTKATVEKSNGKKKRSKKATIEKSNGKKKRSEKATIEKSNGRKKQQ